MKRFTPLFAFFALLIPVGLFFFPKEEVFSLEKLSLAEATYRDFQVDIETLGTLQAINSYLVSSQIRGPGAKIIFLAPDGYPVKKGDILVRFDPTVFEESISEHSAQIDDLSAAVEASRELLEWEKTEVGQQIATAEYN
ncbi:MAG: hypothetical protein ACN4GW_12210, partial [Desulforhopalus sp.]